MKSRLKVNEIRGLQNCKQNICWILISVNSVLIKATAISKWLCKC